MKRVVGIFAHPDDEAFGPGGTLAQFAKEHEVYLICVTNGDGKQTTRIAEKKLGEIRKKELLASAAILGVKAVSFLGYKDGSLCHNLYHEIADKVQKKLVELQPDTVITFEPRGVSGHLDHIAVSMITSFVFYKLPFIKTLLYYCQEESFRNQMKDYFIHVPPGYRKSEISKIMVTTDVWETKVKAMHIHKSQIEDVNRILQRQEGRAREEYFLLAEKE